MYLKALEIQGFKSFPDKTVLTFGSDVTAIVGPNGSGKSNVSDAIRWVMGEQSSKSLRGSKMEDVIFSGTEKRGQMGFAQVTLVIDNTEHIFPQLDESEVAVTRRYYRSGESEYYINRQSVRLRDVNELFMDTGMGREGYALIGQGRIDEILSVKSEDRREIFEEAAGISKFRHRKEESERKLERTEDNLLRINDKIAELALQVEPLREQAEKAKRYHVLRDELRALEISVWVEQLSALRAGKVKLDTDLSLARAELEREQGLREQSYAETERCGERIRENDLAQEQQRGEISAVESRCAEEESAAAVLRTELSHHQDDAARLEQELSMQGSRADELSAQIAQQQEHMRALSAQGEQAQSELSALLARAQELARSTGEAEDEDRALRAREALCLSAAADRRAELSALRAQTAQMDERRAAIKAETQELAPRLEEAGREAKKTRRALEEAQDDAQAAQNVISGHELKMSGRVQREQEASERRVALTMELNNLDSRIRLLSEMEKEYEGFNKAVKSVMRAAGQGALRGVRGPVASLMQTDRRCAVAIEIALGAGLQNLVVEREEDAKAAIELLKRTDAGRATFLPLRTIRGDVLREQGLARETGYVGLACELVQYDSEYENIFANLLGRTVVVEDLDCGIAMARRYQNRFRIVTLDGQIINRGGSMTGGSVSRSAGILSRANELKELRAKQQTLSAQRAAAETEAEAAKRDLTAAQYALDVARSDKRRADDEVLRLTGEKNRLAELLSVLSDRSSGAEDELAALAAAVQENGERAAALEREATEQECLAAQHRAAADSRAQGRGELLRDSSRLNDEIAAKKSDIAAAAAEYDATARALASLQTLHEQALGDGENRREQLAQQRRAIEQAQQNIAAREAAAQALRTQIDGMRTALSALVEAKLALEGERSAAERRSREQNETVLNATQAVTRLEQKRETAEQEERGILDKLWEHYELGYSEAEAQRVELESMPKAQRRISELKRGISALGAVNVNAIEDFERINGRYTYLTTQRDDVERARGELLGVIEGITREMTGIFAEQFALIRDSFEITFRELFGGGKATLELEDENDILNCGIEIKVQPPGKALKTLSLLSGGEKAFVAIALYFAILKVHPTPFCVMDEIEAALDEANVVRVANYMRRICDKTQFIVITHRRGTMESADVLYGVTMQERGVSKVLTINMNDMAKELKIKE